MTNAACSDILLHIITRICHFANSKTKKHKMTKIGKNNQCTDFQIKLSNIKVTGRQNPLNMTYISF